tara:strand:- start:288 stop:641 length:354 start_codon:yes stop_codon:yes gene_type:complete
MQFRSGLEEKVAALFDELGVIYEYESTKIPYVIQHNYTPDFLLANGIYLETKGYWDASDRRKIKAVKTLHPEIDLRMVFQSPYNTISKRSKTTYAQYCDKLSIPWTSFTNIPIDWLT